MTLVDSPGGFIENLLQGSPDRTIPPSWAGSRRLKSLTAYMQWFHFCVYIQLAEVMGLAHGATQSDEMPDVLRDRFSVLFTIFHEDCVLLDLTASAVSVTKILNLCGEQNKHQASMAEFQRLWSEFYGRLIDETQSKAFFALSTRESEQYAEPWKGWEEVIEQFPTTSREILEASRCLSVARYTATVFHLMRVMEIGLRSLGKSLSDDSLDPSRNPSWDAILKKCEKELQKPIRDRSPEWRADDKFFSTAAANLRAVQYAWRNPTLHVENHYNEEEAREIYSASKGFMRHLATKLGEDWGDRRNV